MKDMLLHFNLKYLETIYSNDLTCVYRVFNPKVGKKFIVKTNNSDLPKKSQLERIKYEYEILSKLKHPFIVKALELLKYQNLYAILFEDIDAEALTGKTVPIEKFLNLAIKITEGLAYCHNSKIIHNDINPSNIVFNTQTEKINIIDFGIASLVQKESRLGKSIDDIEGTLPFISPEQTGRVNRSTDYRSDYYSLGASFFKILTGNYLFDGLEDSLQWVHAHISKTSQLLSQKVFPSPILAIIRKLIEKDPADRYQSANGIISDLTECRRQFENTGTIKPFEIGCQDRSITLTIPEKLYGRKNQIISLGEEVLKTPHNQQNFTLITGTSGSGKSSLVNEIQKTIIEQQGLYFNGKFEQFAGNTQFFAVIQILDQMISKVLGLSKGKKDVWHAKINESLGNDVSFLLDFHAPFKRILANENYTKPINNNESQAKLYRAILTFIESLVPKDGCVVLFIDDLQWTDYQTMHLLEYYLENLQSFKNILFLGCYRSNEINEGHPVYHLQIKAKSYHKLKIIETTPLNIKNIGELLSDMFKQNADEVTELAKEIHKKTAGNPFFINETIKSFYDQDLILYDQAENAWNWDLEGIKKTELSKNVVAFMITKLNQIPEKHKKVLRYCAAIGNRFTLNKIQSVASSEQIETIETLKFALKEELIISQSHDYRFLYNKAMSFEDCQDLEFVFRHDRIQQAAYKLNTKSSIKNIHNAVARGFIKIFENDLSSHSLEILKHAEIGEVHLESDEDKNLVSSLYYSAGQKTFLANSFSVSSTYFEKSLSLLNINYWDNDYSKAYDISKKLMDAYCLSGQFKSADRVFLELEQKCKNDIDLAEVYLARLTQFIMEGKHEQAVDIGIKGLRLLSIRIKKNTSTLRFLLELAKTKWNFRKIKAQDILSIEPSKSRKSIIKQKILRELCSPAYLLGYDNFSLFCALKLASFSIAEGVTDSSSFGIASLGLVLIAIEKKYEEAYKFSKIGLELEKKYPNPKSRCGVFFLHAYFIVPWNKSFDHSKFFFDEALNAGLNSGDLTFLSYTCSQYAMYAEFNSELSKAIKAGEKCHSIVVRCNYDFITHLSLVHQCLRKALAGHTKSFHLFSNKDWNSIESYRLFKEKNFTNGFVIYHSCRTQALYLKGYYKRALSHAYIVFKNQKAILGSPYLAEFLFYASLALIKVYDKYGSHKMTLKLFIPMQLKFFRKLAKVNPDHFACQYYFLKSEYLRVNQDWKHSLTDLQVALNYANQYNQKSFLAIFHETLAVNYSIQGAWDYMKHHYKLAYYYYDLWGAKAKCHAMKSVHPEYYLEEKEISYEKVTQLTLGTTRSNNFDMITAVKSSQAISEEVRADKIIENLLPIIAENSGASRVVMIIYNKEEDKLEVYSSFENNNYIENDKKIDLENHHLIISSIQKAFHTKKTLIENNPDDDDTRVDSMQIKVKSLMIVPIIYKKEFSGLIYLENRLLTHAFNQHHTHLLGLIATQAAISLENANLYSNLEEKVKRRTLELNKKNNRLAKAVEENKNLVRLLCHDLNNSVTIIGLLASRVLNRKKGLVSDEKNQDYWKKVDKAARNQREIIDHVREMEAINAGKKNFELKPVNFSKVIEHIRFVFQDQLLAKEIELKYRPHQQEDIYLFADEVSLKNQIISNIVSNAIKFSDRKSVISIETASVKNGKTSVYISDQGKGMPKEISENIFKMEAQTSRSGTEGESGTGFGMPLVKVFMDHFQASIEVESRDIDHHPKNHGTTFILTFQTSEPGIVHKIA